MSTLKPTLLDLRNTKRNLQQELKAKQAEVKKVDKAIAAIEKIEEGTTATKTRRRKTKKQTAKRPKIEIRRRKRRKPLRDDSNTKLVFDIIKEKNGATAADVFAAVTNLPMDQVYNICNVLKKRGFIKSNGDRPATYTVI